jgi:hypothetical protein
VPDTGSVVTSMKVLPGAMVENRVVESGLLTVNRTDIAVVRRKLTRSPATPVKLTRPFWPGTVIGIEAAAPPGVVVADASAGTL